MFYCNRSVSLLALVGATWLYFVVLGLVNCTCKHGGWTTRNIHGDIPSACKVMMLYPEYAQVETIWRKT